MIIVNSGQMIVDVVNDGLPRNREEYIKKQDEWVKNNNITKETMLRPTKKVPSHTNGWENEWAEEMVIAVNEGRRGYFVKNAKEYGIRLSIGCCYPYFVLEIIEKQWKMQRV